MKKHLAVFSALIALGALIAARAQPAPASAASAEADYAAFKALAAEKPPGTQKELGNEKYFTWIADQRGKIAAAGLAFHEKYSADPRRWEVLTTTLGQPPLFVKSFGPDVATKGFSAAVIDQEARTAWETKGEALRKALLASADATPAQKEGVDWYFFAKDFRATTAAKSKGEKFDYAPFHDRFDAHAAKYSQLPNLGARASDYLGALESSLPGQGVKEWNYLLASSPHESLRTAARAELDRIAKKAAVAAELASKPMELAFTAVDGRAVDLAKLRGKVVLIDFWATWCNPCIAELPNVKKVYAAYHDQGFEIVGISLDRDTDRQKLIDFTANEKMPWPQHYDGKYWQNEIAVRYDIRAIPAMFLLDKEGKVVSTNARGPALEREVKRLLKL